MLFPNFRRTTPLSTFFLRVSPTCNFREIPHQGVLELKLTLLSVHEDVDFTKLMEKWNDHPPRDDSERGLLSMAKAPISASMSTPIVEVTVSGVNKVLSKALEEAQEGYKATWKEAQAVMKDAKDEHKAAVRVTCTHNHIHTHEENLLYIS